MTTTDNSKIEVSDAQWPLIVVRYPEEFSLTEYREVHKVYRELSKRALLDHVGLSYLIDFTRFDPVHAPPMQRKVAAAAFKENREFLEPVTVAEARVVRRASSRMVLTGFDWLTNQPWPCKNFAEEEAALKWLREKSKAF